MNHRSIRALAALTLFAAPIFAETVVLRSGARLEGEILSRDLGKVRIQARGTIYTLAEKDILSIESSEKWRTDLADAIARIRGGELSRGAQVFAEAIREGADPASVENALRETTTRLMQGIRLSGLDAVDFRLAMKDIVANENLTDESLFILAQVFHAADDTETATKILARLGPDAVRADDQRIRWTTSILRSEVRRLSRAAKFEEAIESAALLETLAGAPSNTHLPIVYLARASQARERGEFSDAITIVTENLAPLAPEIARNRAGFLIRDVEAEAARTGEFVEARRTIALAAKRFPIEAAASRNRLHSAEAIYLLDRNRPAEAFALLDTLSDEERSGEAGKLWIRADYERRAKAVDTQDPLALLELGRWAAENKLLDESIALFRRVTDNPAMRDIAIRQLTLVEDARDVREIEEAVALYDKGMARDAAEITARLIADGVNARAAGPEAERMDRVARKDIDSELRRRPYLAEISFQQAERAFYQEDYDRSLEVLGMLLKQYGDTPAAERAKGLIPAVLDAVELEVVEGRRKEFPRIGFDVSAARTSEAAELRIELDSLLEAYDAPPAEP